MSLLHKNTDHVDIYSKLKIKDEVQDHDSSVKYSAADKDSMYKFQKNMSLDKGYETMLNIDKAVSSKSNGNWLEKEPMERVVMKIR